MSDSEIVVRPLSPTLLADWLAFFDKEAFVDNPNWAKCYCHFYHADHSERDWDERAAGDNRSASIQLIRRGRLRGHLAYMKDKAVGWCQACPRAWVPNLDSNPQLRIDDTGRVGSILCFLVAPDYRKLGVGRRLLAAACDGLMEVGIEIAEAYPRRSAKSDASNYHGPLSMFLEAGFEPYREFEDYLIVRKPLAGAPSDH
jgi:GNAT superfamily N-acetyltransferase